MDLSIIIPAFNESKKIRADIAAAAEFLNQHNFRGEIIVVDDGSSDNTAQAAESVKTPRVSVRVLRSDKNYGKGHAVRTGMLISQGEFAMFADSGNCVPYENTLTGLQMIKDGQCDIAHGSRKMPGCRIKKPQKLHRRILSKLFRWVMRLFMDIPYEFTDTQCGFKIYKGSVARKIYGQCITDGFMFDVETIIRAQKMGYTIKEFPVEWTNDRDSRLSIVRTAWQVLIELATIKRSLSKDNSSAVVGIYSDYD